MKPKNNEEIEDDLNESFDINEFLVRIEAEEDNLNEEKESQNAKIRNNNHRS